MLRLNGHVQVLPEFCDKCKDKWIPLRLQWLCFVLLDSKKMKNFHHGLNKLILCVSFCNYIHLSFTEERKMRKKRTLRMLVGYEAEMKLSQVLQGLSRFLCNLKFHLSTKISVSILTPLATRDKGRISSNHPSLWWKMFPHEKCQYKFFLFFSKCTF